MITSVEDGRAKPIYELSQWKNLLLCRAAHQFKTEDKDKVPAVEKKQEGNPNILHLYMVTVCFPGIKTEAEISRCELAKTFSALFYHD